MTATPEADAAGVGEPETRGPSAFSTGTADGPREAEASAALVKTRLAWAVALAIQLLNLGYELSFRTGAVVAWPLRPAVLALVVLLIGVFVAHTARLQAYKRGWRGRVVTPAGYLRANLLMLAVLTLAACVIFGSAPFTGVDRPLVRVLGLALTLATLLNWPHGRPMRAAVPAKV